MKSLLTPIILAATAVFQAYGSFQFTGDTVVLAGKIFFPILFALMAIFLVWRNPDTADRFGGPHVLLLGLSVIALLASIAGKVASIFQLYPQVLIYYAVFALLVVELGLRIAALPKRVKERKVSKRQARRNRGTNLVATPKGTSASQDAARGTADDGTSQRVESENSSADVSSERA